jgi:hypothetical protein
MRIAPTYMYISPIGQSMPLVHHFSEGSNPTLMRVQMHKSGHTLDARWPFTTPWQT